MPFPNANFQKLEPVALTGTNGHRLGWKSIMDHMLANGFSHVESGDGLSAFSTGTLQITNSGTGANGVNPGAHVVLRDGNGEDIQLTFVTEGGAGSSHGYDVSPADGFTGGTASAKGSATDQGTISNGTSNGFINFATTNYVVYGYCENVSPFRFLYCMAKDHVAGSSNSDRTKPDHSFFRDTFGPHSFPEDTHPNHYVYAYGSGQALFENAAGNGWQVHCYKDGSSPATSANFQLLRHGSGSFTPDPPLAGVVQDTAGLTALALKFQFDVAVRRALPSLTSLMFKGNVDSGIGCRTFEADTNIGGTLDTAGDAVSLGNLIHPWSPPTPRINLADDFSGASGIAAHRLYHEQGVFGGESGIAVPTPPAAIPGGFTNFFEDIILNFIRGTSPTAPVTTYMSLHTADPGEDAAVGEVVGNGYARQVITFGAPVSGSGIMINNSAPLFTASGGGWGIITHFAIWDAVSGGNPIQKGPTAADASVVDGDTFRAEIGTVFLTAG